MEYTMQAVQGNDYWIWSDHSAKGAAKAIGVTAGASLFLSLSTNALLTPSDYFGGLATLGISVTSSVTGVLASRAIDKIENSSSDRMKTAVQTTAGVFGGALLLLTAANNINIIYIGDLLPLGRQFGFSIIGAVAGGLLGRFTKKWGLALANAGTSTGLAGSLGAFTSLGLPHYSKLLPIPTMLSFSSLLGHPFVK